ncbi:hypothetical protein [Paractinoplanes durhamensis]
MSSSNDAFVYDTVRTPRGRGKDTGALHGTKPITLVAGLIDALRDRNPGLDPAAIDDLVLGIVTPVGEQGGDLPAPPHCWPASRRPPPACSSTASAAPAWRRSTRPPPASAPAGST